MADDEPAAELLSCLRENLRELRVEIHYSESDRSGRLTAISVGRSSMPR